MSKVLTFDEWMKEVDKCLEGLCGMTSGDLPDALYRDAYDKKVKPMAMAKRVFKQTKADFGM